MTDAEFRTIAGLRQTIVRLNGEIDRALQAAPTTTDPVMRLNMNVIDAMRKCGIGLAGLTGKILSDRLPSPDGSYTITIDKLKKAIEEMEYTKQKALDLKESPP